MADLVVRPSSDTALVDQLERQLAEIHDVAEAEQFWRSVSAVDVAARVMKLHADEQLRFGKLKLRAEKRWGELLGEAEQGGDRRSDQVSSGNLKTADRLARHRARQVAAVPEPVFTAYVDKANDPETLRRARLLRIAREKEAEKRRQEKVAPVQVSAAVETRHGDFRSVLDDLVGTVDAIITDPPYAREFHPLYTDLAARASTLLKPTGSLVVLCGTRPDAWLRLVPNMEAHIALRWVGCYLADGPAWRDHQARVATNWKPVLIFGGTRGLNSDVWRSRSDSAQSREADLAWHHWGQNLDGFTRLVEAFTDPGDLVVDPFLGGGTTGDACRRTGRRFVGCDTDAAAIAAARERLAA